MTTRRKRGTKKKNKSLITRSPVKKEKMCTEPQRRRSSVCVCGSRAKKSKFNVQQKKKLEIESGFSDRGRSCHYAINLTPSSLKKKNKKYLGKRFT